jgi:sugar phosphate permease
MVQKTTERTIGRLSAWQRRVFFLCWGAYTLAYLTRINLSIAIPLIEQELLFDKTVIGLITGWVAQRIGWSAVLVVWMVAALMAGVWAQVSARRAIRTI